MPKGTADIKRKKILALLLSVAAIMAMAACGSAGGATEPAPSPTETPAEAAAPSGESPDTPAAEASDEVSGEASEQPGNEPSGDAVSGEPASGENTENTAHGGSPGAITLADYKAYLKAWVEAEQSVNAGMTDGQKDEIFALIDAGSYTESPAAALFDGTMLSGAAMTYDEFVSADGVY